MTELCNQDVGPATPPPSWCLPDAEPSWDHVTERFGGGTVCTWTRNVPAEDPNADVWIQAEDRIIGGRVMRTAPRICMFEQESLTQPEAIRLAGMLLKAADIIAATVLGL